MPFGLDAQTTFYACAGAGVALVLLALILMMLLLLRRRSMLPGASETLKIEKLVVLLAPNEKVIESGIAGVFISLDKFFSDMGFTVFNTKTPARFGQILKQGAPVIIAVDCRIGPRALRQVDQICRDCEGLKDTVVFFYNAAKPEKMKPPPTLPHASYLGQDFASIHVLELVSYAISVDSSSEPAGAQREPCALEGKIHGHALAEVLQFLEVGRRTGMLSVEAKQPAGVINFEDGAITFAQTRAREGFEAVLEILSVSEGSFHFFANKRVRQVNCRLSAQEVMMQWAYRQDEGAVSHNG